MSDAERRALVDALITTRAKKTAYLRELGGQVWGESQFAHYRQLSDDEQRAESAFFIAVSGHDPHRPTA